MLTVECLRTFIIPHLRQVLSFIDADGNVLGGLHVALPATILNRSPINGGWELRPSIDLQIGNTDHWDIVAIDIGIPPLYRSAYKASGVGIILPRNEVLVRLYGEDVSF